MLMMEQESKAPVERMYTLNEVKDFLQIGYGRIFELIDQGKLEAYSLDDADPAHKRALRVPESSVKEYLQTRRVGIGIGEPNERNQNH